MRADIITIGDEILIGDTVNTNASWMGQFLSERGVRIHRVITISDQFHTIQEALADSARQAELTIMTGGLGPTHDDITKKAIVDWLGVGTVRHQPTLEHIRKIFAKRNFTMSQANYEQADVPENAEVLFNKAGTAPGMWIDRDGHHLAILPGVPHEMKYLIEHLVWPKIRELQQLQHPPRIQYLRTASVPESTLSELVIGDLSGWINDHLEVAYLPGSDGVTIRVTAYPMEGESRESTQKRLKGLVDHIHTKAFEHIFAFERSVSMAAHLGELLRDKGLSVVAAESCTGGLLTSTLTDIPGSSDYALGGWVAYSNAMKTAELGVPEAMIAEHGAVSKPVALQMARAAAEQSGADIGISTTGIAGPGGGTDEKPVGTVWIGYYSGHTHFALRAVLTNNRQINKERSVHVALDTIRRTISDYSSLPYGLAPHFPS